MKKLANFGRKIRRLFSKKRKCKNVSTMKYFTILIKKLNFHNFHKNRTFEHFDAYLNLINRILKNAFAVFHVHTYCKYVHNS